MTAADRAAIARQTGRAFRGDFRVAVRCPCGLPAVVETFPVVDGAPFPTLYWLTCARAVREISRLEAAGGVGAVNRLIREDPGFAGDLEEASRSYVARRDALHPLPGAGGIGGERPGRIKCLHVHYAHHAVTGTDPVGRWIEERTGPLLSPPPCVQEGS